MSEILSVAVEVVAHPPLQRLVLRPASLHGPARQRHGYGPEYRTRRQRRINAATFEESSPVVGVRVSSSRCVMRCPCCAGRFSRGSGRRRDHWVLARERSHRGADRVVGLLWPEENEWLPSGGTCSPRVCAMTDGEMGIAFGVTEHLVQERAVKCCGGSLAIRARLAYARSVSESPPVRSSRLGASSWSISRPPDRWLKTALSRTICSALNGGA